MRDDIKQAEGAARLLKGAEIIAAPPALPVRVRLGAAPVYGLGQRAFTPPCRLC